MNDVMEVAIRVVLIGVGATAVMDLWLIALKKVGVPTLNFSFLGRWVGHVFRGTWFHDSMAKTLPIKGEYLFGWLAHYAIGIGFAGLLVSMVGITWTGSPTVMPAVLTGVATVIAPLFIMQPAMGSGVASSKTATPLRNCLKSVANHAVFGCGLYLAASVLIRI